MASPGIGKAIYDKARKRYARIDENGRLVTNAVDTFSAGVVDGVVFFASFFSSLAGGATIDILLSASVPTFIDLTLSSKGTSLDGFDVTVFEGTTVSANGTPVPVFNRNRNSSNTADFQVFQGPTVTTPGTEINRSFVPAGSVSTSRAIGLNPDFLYLFRIANNGTGNDDFYFATNIAEITDIQPVSTSV